MVYPNSGSLLTPQIHSGLSTQIVVKVDSTTVGAIQRLQIQQNRDMNVWEEIGTDGIVEIHPKGATKININVSRIVFDELRITEAFARSFVNLQSQRIPFNIYIIDKTSSVNEKYAIIHVLNNCWFNRYSPTYQAENFLIMEEASLVCEYITSSREGQAVPYGGSRGISYEYDTIERSTDVNGRCGRLDSAGLLTRD